MDTRTAAHRWADTWRENWIAGDPEPIVALYAADAPYSTAPFRAPHIGPDGARAYVRSALAEEDDVQAWFGDPICDGDRAAIAWWASYVENGAEVTIAGISMLRFDEQGLVVNEWDAWNQTDGRIDPPAEWQKRR